MSKVIAFRAAESDYEKIQESLAEGESASSWVYEAVKMRLNPPKKAPPLPKKPKDRLELYIELWALDNLYAWLSGHDRRQAAVIPRMREIQVELATAPRPLHLNEEALSDLESNLADLLLGVRAYAG